MTTYKRFALTAVAVVVTAGGGWGTSLAGEPQRHVTGESRIGREVETAIADRQALGMKLQAEDLQAFADEKFEMVAPDRGSPYFGPGPDVPAVVVPEPGTMVLLGVGLAALAARRKAAARKSRRRT